MMQSALDWKTSSVTSTPQALIRESCSWTSAQVFNTIAPELLRHKLTVPSCQWITSLLTNRRRQVRRGSITSGTWTISTGVPLGCVLSPLLFSLHTNDCTAGNSSVRLLKYADDTYSVRKKVQQRLHIRRRLRKFNTPEEQLVTFYTAIMQSLLWTSSTVWFGSATKQDNHRVQQTVRIIVYVHFICTIMSCTKRILYSSLFLLRFEKSQTGIQLLIV